MPSVGNVITQVLGASGSVAPCLYTLQYPKVEDKPQQRLDAAYLDTYVINQYLKSVNTIDPSVDISAHPISVDVVCNIGPQWEYHFYEVPTAVNMTVSSRITGKDRELLVDSQERFLQDNAFVRHKIVINQWALGESIFNTLLLPNNQTGGTIGSEIGPTKVLEDWRFLLFGKSPEIETPYPLKQDEPILGHPFQFPGNYSCVFLSRAIDLKYDVKSTSKIALVQHTPRNEEWEIVFLSLPQELCTYPAEYEPNESVPVSERRVYVKTNEAAATTVRWTNDDRDYWLTVVSKALVFNEEYDLALFEVIEGDVPEDKRPSRGFFTKAKHAMTVEAAKVLGFLDKHWG